MKNKNLLKTLLVFSCFFLVACGKNNDSLGSTINSSNSVTENESNVNSEIGEDTENTETIEYTETTEITDDNSDFVVSPLETIEDLSGKTDAEIVEIIKKNIVKITNKVNNETEIVATGFFIKEGYLLTNSHVVDIFGEISIEYYDGSIEPAMLVANNIAADIAILYVENPKAKALNMATTEKLEIMTDVMSVGFAYGLAGEATATKGYLSARRESLVADTQYLQCDAALVEGCSGSPLLDKNGFVIGLNTFANETSSINLSITTECLENKIAELINNPSVQYIDDSRPESDISSLLYLICCTDSDIYNEDKILGNNLKPGIYEIDDDNWNLFFDAKFSWDENKEFPGTYTLNISFSPKENVYAKEGGVFLYIHASTSQDIILKDENGKIISKVPETSYSSFTVACAHNKRVSINFGFAEDSFNRERNAIVFEAEGYVEVK